MRTSEDIWKQLMAAIRWALPAIILGWVGSWSVQHHGLQPGHYFLLAIQVVCFIQMTRVTFFWPKEEEAE